MVLAAYVICGICNLLLSVETVQTSILITLDISESFNTVDHEIVLFCLREVAGSKVIH